MTDSHERTESAPSSDRRPRVAGIVAALVVVVAGLAWFIAQPPGPYARSGPVPDFASMEDVKEKKAAFFEFLAPMIAEQNRWVLEQRATLREARSALAEGGSLPGSLERRVRKLAERYLVDLENGVDVAVVDRLLVHCDVVPPSLALAQAAAESGWGASRFARLGNNYFGEWCFSEDCGMVPGNRGAGRTHEVETFDAVEDAVDSYFRNLNRVDVYERLRELRASARRAGAPITGRALATGLGRYSERGDVYIEEIRELIRFNGLARYDETQLRPLLEGASE
ncbi:MAG: glucosaminidase domain-containing protein [Pseudomonadales bacterium]|nr:glucosaminidase domain-containing protein [Pseudomonadales bacterium]